MTHTRRTLAEALGAIVAEHGTAEEGPVYLLHSRRPRAAQDLEEFLALRGLAIVPARSLARPAPDPWISGRAPREWR